jgi:hypothetical protein
VLAGFASAQCAALTKSASTAACSSASEASRRAPVRAACGARGGLPHVESHCIHSDTPIAFATAEPKESARDARPNRCAHPSPASGIEKLRRGGSSSSRRARPPAKRQLSVAIVEVTSRAVR